MKNKLLIIICYILSAFLAAGLFMTFVYPFLKWQGIEATPMNIWVVDKTVPNMDYREHKGFVWVLNNKKITNAKTGQEFRFDADYFGFIPQDKEQYNIKELPSAIEKPDIIYITDTYGVYKDDYLTNKTEGTRSELIYGGLTDKELASVKANLGSGNTIISEFNTDSAPTNIANREMLAEIFRLQWKGWSGRYFHELTKSVEVPAWTVNNYEKQSGKAWNFEGEGFVLVSDEDRVVVLKNGQDVGKSGIQLFFEDSFKKEFGIEKDVKYEYWFEFTAPDPSAELLASYKIDLTESGKAIFKELGLPQTFPAVIRNSNVQFKSYYFAGDFADSKNSGNFSKFYGFARFKSIFTFASKGDNEDFYWKAYVPLMSKILDDSKINKHKKEDILKSTNLQYEARTYERGFQIKLNGQWKDFFSKGANIGSSTPGRAFTEFSRDESMYLRWFEMIGSMNSNAIRVYTLQAPQFYSALEYYNKMHPSAPLWLYQELWPDENPENGNYLGKDYNHFFQQEMQNVIDAIHGQANIPPRSGRAYGIYTSDVSQYIIGYLIGRELEPEEVIKTNELNSNLSYNGKFLYTEKGASPTEAWLAMSCDYVLNYEKEKYNWQHAVGIVSWPTLDPIQHDSEWNETGNKSLEYNDKVSVDINHISKLNTLEAGFFGAYHIYPNYPDFMNNEESYAAYKDEEGVFRYGGYLREFISGHKKYPALIAEFGISTSMETAHVNPDGYNHGGVTEAVQGDGIVRMMKAINKEGYAGGLIFEWTDEWAKKTWTTEPFIIPFDRNVYWHNAIDPEQNYGILAVESNSSKSKPYSINGNGKIKTVKLTADETYLGVELELAEAIDFNNEKLFIGLDIYDRSRGNFKFSDDNQNTAPSGLEFEIQINGEKDAALLVQPNYNKTKYHYSSAISPTGLFERMINQINKERVTKSGKTIPAIFTDESILRYGKFDNNSYFSWYIEGNRIFIRLPWTRINFTDPSKMRVLDDTSPIIAPVTDQLKTVVSDGVLVSGLLIEKMSGSLTGMIGSKEDKPFTWINWNDPSYKERLKGSYSTISDYFATVN